MRLIVNADDLGLSEAVNQETFALMAEGLVTSASIMAAGRAVASLPGRMAALPGISFGVHLTLTELQPVSGSAGLEPLLDEGGAFCNVIRQTHLAPPLLTAIRRELCAQVEFVRGLGAGVSHADSHHHMHTIPQLLPVLKDVLRSCGVPAVRLSKNLYCRRERPGLPRLVQKSLFNLVLTRLPRLRHADYFTNLHGLLETLPSLGPGPRSAEVMVHAGTQAAHSQDEIALLRALPAIPGARQLRFVSYRDV
ncbi:MAG: ChbG/HpnK family deacetylase [Humidesulfovibrio sp.]|nr:ChbG/HpnK family deacetylase [Humidesulfovibrio sp.]